jgi:hypothetical protein
MARCGCRPVLPPTTHTPVDGPFFRPRSTRTTLRPGLPPCKPGRFFCPEVRSKPMHAPIVLARALSRTLGVHGRFIAMTISVRP